MFSALELSCWRAYGSFLYRQMGSVMTTDQQVSSSQTNSDRTNFDFYKFLIGDMISIFTIFALFGGGTNMVVCAALGLTAELIGDNHSSGAFVYGLMSFGDKVINGLTVVVLEKLNSCNYIAPDETRGECSAGSICEFYGQFVSYGTSGILIFGLIFILIQHKQSAQNISKS